MHEPKLGSSWIFVVDTNRYSGNFEREMCAYMTGQVGECGVGEEAAEKFREDMGGLPPDDETYAWLEQRADDHGTLRPASIWTTPGWYGSRDGTYAEGDPMLEGRHPAYLSVAIFMSRKPTDEEITFLKDRAQKFVAEDHSRFGLKEEMAISGFRLIEEVTTQKEEAI